MPQQRPPSWRKRRSRPPRRACARARSATRWPVLRCPPTLPRPQARPICRWCWWCTRFLGCMNTSPIPPAALPAPASWRWRPSCLRGRATPAPMAKLPSCRPKSSARFPMRRSWPTSMARSSGPQPTAAAPRRWASPGFAGVGASFGFMRSSVRSAPVWPGTGGWWATARPTRPAIPCRAQGRCRPRCSASMAGPIPASRWPRSIR